jgi:site-specific DNA recombinase
LERRLERPSAVEHTASQRPESIATLKRRLGRLIDAYENGWLEREEFESRMRRVKERLDREEAAHAQHQLDSTASADLRLIVHKFQAFADQITAGLENADFATRRQLLRLLIQRIEIDADEVRIVYKVTPHPFALGPDRGILQDCLKSQRKARRRGAHAGKWREVGVPACARRRLGYGV